MMKLIEQVEQAQLVIKSINVKETTLEEAFLQLTGKTLGIMEDLWDTFVILSQFNILWSPFQRYYSWS